MFFANYSHLQLYIYILDIYSLIFQLLSSHKLMVDYKYDNLISMYFLKLKSLFILFCV